MKSIAAEKMLRGGVDAGGMPWLQRRQNIIRKGFTLYRSGHLETVTSGFRVKMKAVRGKAAREGG
jgi:hypothetical protein